MSEHNVIRSSNSPATVKSLYQDLTNMGIINGDTVLVHSSMSSIGWICGGAHAAVLALLKATGADTDGMGGGTLVMPAHSGDLSDPAEWEQPPVPKDWIPVIYESMPAYDSQVTPTRGMGRIAELFRTYPGVLRSGHPQVSFCASGKAAAFITENHPLTPQFGMESPLGKLYGLGAKVLLLGVGYCNCTSFHLAEACLERMPVKRMGAALLENGARVWKWFDDYNYDSDDFEQIGEAFEESNPVVKGNVGNAECRLFDMKTGVDFAAVWLGKNRRCWC